MQCHVTPNTASGTAEHRTVSPHLASHRPALHSIRIVVNCDADVGGDQRLSVDVVFDVE
jgi:hypothetical protein